MSELTEEHARVFGDPSETWVQEATWMLHRLTDKPYVACEDVAALLCERGDVTATEAQERIQLAIRNGEIDVHVWPSGWATLSLDPIVDLRLERRYMFWTLLRDHHRRMEPHYPNEYALARAAILHWNELHDEPPDSNDVIATVTELAGYAQDPAALNAVLNALDAGAIYALAVVPDELYVYKDMRYFVTPGWTEP